MQKSPDQQCKMQEIAYKRAKGCVTLFYFFFVYYTINNKAKIISVIGEGGKGKSVTKDMKKKLKGDTNE